MTEQDDAGLNAVARVRGAREQDSRIGLQQAMAELRDREARVAALRQELASVEHPEELAVADFVMHHERVRAFVQSVDEAQQEAASATAVAAAARAHWAVDKARLAAVEMLLERRAEERREEDRRREARDLDEVVTQQWLRSRDSGGAA